MYLGCLFYASDQNTALFILLLKLFQSWSLGAPQVSLVSGTCLQLADAFLLSGMTGSCRFSGMFSALALESAISLGSPGSSCWRILLETKIWALVGGWLLLGCCCFSALSADTARENMCVLTGVHTHVSARV